MRRIAVVAAAAVGCWLPTAPAHADDTVVVPGTSFPTSSTYLTYFGCTDLFHADTRGPATRVDRDDAAPLGRRALGLAVPGAGTATGPVSLVGSVAGVTHQLSVAAPAGSAGVAYVWYVAPDLDPGQVWAGRADLVTAVDGWQRVDPAVATYSWTRYDAATGALVDTAGPAGIGSFTGEHGDGPGYLLAGFGCDGAGFDLDAVSIGAPGDVTTYDLEGWPVTTSITAAAADVPPGGQVVLTGVSTDPQQRAMGAALQLEARPAGAAEFAPVGEPVPADASGQVTTTVTPDVTTDYRWAFPETGYADANWSPVERVVVTR